MPSPKSPSNNTEQNHPHDDGRFGHGKMNAQALYLASLLCLSLLLPAFVSPAPLSEEQKSQVMVLPTRTDEQGEHVSFDLLPPGGADDQLSGDRHYFRIDAVGRTLRLNVTESTGSFLSAEHEVEYHHSQHGVRRGNGDVCRHFTGSVREETEEGAVVAEGGWAAISYCTGLRGVIASEVSGYLYIEPEGAAPEKRDSQPHPHLLHSSPHLSPGRSCSYEKTQSSETPPSDGVRVHRSLDSTHLSSERWVEVAVVADHTMVEYHGVRELEAYLFTLMNMVAHLYRDPTIGHAMNIVVIKTIILETQQSGLSVSTDALTSLASFCSWQSSHFSSSSSSFPGQPDVSLLVTRANICEGFGAACGTLGIAEFKGACSSSKSCNINKDVGLATAFTIAHELGHSLGIRHDGDMSVVCEPDDHFIMAPTFAQSHNPHIWSHCSRQQLAEFLLSPESSCLNNQPATSGGNSSSPLSSSGGVPLPGLETTPTEQCQLMLGDHASHCGLNTSSEFCNRLWCRVDNQSECVHHHIPPASGTGCVLETSGGEGVCYQGACVEFSNLTEPVEGGWGEWGEWEPCSQSCGTGVQGSSRTCDSPPPANGGRYCLGASHRHQTCSSAPCPAHSDIRQELCDSEPPHSRYSQWLAPSLDEILRRKLDPCSHHCLSQPNNVLFSLMMDLPDGTPCLFTAQPTPSLPLAAAPVPESLGVCVSGECLPMNCNNTLYSMASRDVCGVWCGDGSTCVPVSDTYTIPEVTSTRDTDDYMYHRAVTIPQGSGQVKISEIRHTDNLYLAATTANENFNGNYRVKEGDLDSYWFAGAKWWYERPSTGIECLRTTGVVKEDVTIFIIANSRNLTIHYSAGVPLGNASIFEVSHEWREGEWGRCEGVCGEGVRRRNLDCVANDTGIAVRNDLCDPSTKPLAEEICDTAEECEYKWRVSPWSDCSATCGVGGKTRVIHCILTNNDSTVAPSHCEENSTSPAGQAPCYSEDGCSFEWTAGNWSECSAECGAGRRLREISCVLTDNGTVVESARCDSETRPSSQTDCYSERGCVFDWSISNWSECSAECGAGRRLREISCVLTDNGTEVESARCDSETRPSSQTDCYSERGCVFDWRISNWSECDSDCGWGERERQVTCLLTDNNTAVSESFCLQPRPETRSPCHSNEGCVYSWQYGNWTLCSMDCGQGTRSRDIDCYLTNNHTRVHQHLCPNDTKPAEVSDCHDDSGCVYTWASQPWNNCSNSCGAGIATRPVSCLLLNNKTTVRDELCLLHPRPSSEQTCYSECGCEFIWQSSDWGPCSSVCGGGEREREISCLLTNNGSTVDGVHCRNAAGPQPSTVDTCAVEDCRYEWTVGEWGSCLYEDSGSHCDEGRRSRLVECTLVNNQSVVEEKWCGEAEKPNNSSSCWVDGCVYVWVEGEWGRCDAGCGEGVRERDVHCEQQQSGEERRVDEERCGEGEKPSLREPCLAEPCINFDWVSGDWTKCDAECGEDGSQTRPVSCQHQNGTVVPDSPYCTGKQKPSETRTCSGEPCEPEVCVDNSQTSCHIVVTLRLCHVGTLRDYCCQSCSAF